jgi:hypothetical protein
VDLLIDDLLPTYDSRTRYTRRVPTDRARVWRALHEVTYRELPVTRLLMGIRSAGRARLSGSVVGATAMSELGRREEHELVMGGVARYWQPRPTKGPGSTTTMAGFAEFTEPGWVKAAMSVHLLPATDGTLVVAETRVLATDARARRLFAPYWLLIRVGGAGFIRLEMLRAVGRRAVAAGSPA